MDFRLFEARRLKASPFLRWAGGKQPFLARYGHLIPDFEGTYHEPFVGSASVFLYVQARQSRPIKARLGDINMPLALTLLAVRDSAYEVSDALQNLAAFYLASDNRVEFYREVRDRYNAALPRPNPADFIFLNRTCWNGLYRVNKAGKFNVPHGAHKGDPTFPTTDELLAVSAALQQASIRSTTWQNSIHSARPGDFVFLDPPYFSDLEQGAKYDRDTFPKLEHIELARSLKTLADNKVDFMLTNSGEEEIAAIYRQHGLHVRVSSVPRFISSITSERTPAAEIIVTPNPLSEMSLFENGSH
ncbi:MAG: Dam family site-specific DNA-(adenine-N6)-methyltransferase [Candidatus Velthaea sp.]